MTLSVPPDLLEQVKSNIVRKEKVFWLHERAFFQTEYNLQTV